MRPNRVYRAEIAISVRRPQETGSPRNRLCFTLLDLLAIQIMKRQVMFMLWGPSEERLRKTSL